MDSGPRRSRRGRAAGGETTGQSPLGAPPAQASPSGQTTFFGQPPYAGQAPQSGQPPYPGQPPQSADSPLSSPSSESSQSSPSPQSRVGWSPYDEGRRSRAPLWFAIGGVALLALLGGGLTLMWKAGGSTTTEAARPTRTSAPLPSTPPGKYGFAAGRTTDPDPISVKEFFGSKKKITVSGRAYEMTVTSKDKKCTDGALGDKLQKALKSGKCTQLVRASFRDKSGKVIGTIGVANLKTSGTATKVAKVGDASNYVKPLAGKDSVTKFLGSGSGGARISTHGHYAIMVWFQNKDGSKPDKKGSKRIFEAIKDLTGATVFKALDNRTMTGTALS
ncbi:hypothetical protein ACFFV7_37195 [Nonomuraea spiralis]|uniref:Uncharacterized protein n=1 Tax=Nonomuraea spiralis TaxID=46182 RepID=A0ABV5IQV7_9ACTN|nr:hypothetical protein [Nonomuraea spiralis]